MMNKDFEFSKPLGFGNQQEEKENKEKENMEKRERALDDFIYENIVKENKRQHPSFILDRFGFISTREIENRIERGYFSEDERKEIEQQLQEASEAGYVITKESGRSTKLLMAIIHKVIGNEFFIFRPAKPDQLSNKVSIIIAERNSEEPICALNVVVLQKKRGTRQEENTNRQKIIDNRMRTAYKTNLSGGAELNFFGLKDRKKSNIPFLCAPLETETMSSCLGDFTFPLSKKELDIFGHFLTSIKRQIIGFKKFKEGDQSLPGLSKSQIDDLKPKIKDLEPKIKDLQSKIEKWEIIAEKKRRELGE